MTISNDTAPTPAPVSKLVTIATVRAETSLSLSTINRLMASGVLERVKIGEAVRITGSSYAKLLNSGVSKIR